MLLRDYANHPGHRPTGRRTRCASNRGTSTGSSFANPSKSSWRASSPPIRHSSTSWISKALATAPCAPTSFDAASTLAGAIPLQVSGGIRSSRAPDAALDAGRIARHRGNRGVVHARSALEEFVAVPRGETGRRLRCSTTVELSIRGWQSSTGLTIDNALARLRARRRRSSSRHRHRTRRHDAGSGPRSLSTSVREWTRRSSRRAAYATTTTCARSKTIGCEAAVMGVGYLAKTGSDFRP